MPYNTKFTPSNYQDRDQYNEHVLNERYNTIKSLRESYSNLYQEFTNLRNNMQDFKGEQANIPDRAITTADVNRYNNELENRYLAVKSIQLNTTYPNEYGHMIKPFSTNSSAKQIRLNCHYMISGSHHFKNYHLAKTSCIELLNDETATAIGYGGDAVATGTTLNNGGNLAADAGTSLTVDGTSALTKFAVGDQVYTSVTRSTATFVGIVSSITDANTIVLTTNNLVAVAEDTDLCNFGSQTLIQNDANADITFDLRSFYINKLDATNTATTFGKNDQSQKFNYKDQYTLENILVPEGEFFLLQTQIDGKEAASLLGRNVENAEKILEILANNVNATEQSLNKIIEIAELVGVEINNL